MPKTQEYEITLSLEYSAAPGSDWTAFIGFRSTGGTFSVSAEESDSDGGTHRQNLGSVTGALDWRSACEFLLQSERGFVGGHFGHLIDVSGEDGWKADLLRICWQKHDDDGVPGDIKRFLLDLSDDDLAWLADLLDGDLISEEAVGLIRRYLDEETDSPRVCWQSIAQDRAAPESFLELVETLEKKREEEAVKEAEVAKQRANALDQFAAAIGKIVDDVAPRRPSYTWAGLRGTLRGRIEAFVLAQARLPDAKEVDEIWTRVRRSQ